MQYETVDSKYPHRIHLTINLMHEWDDDMWRLTPLVTQWLEEQVEMPYRVVYGMMNPHWIIRGGSHILFASKQDAVMFKLVWC